MQIKFLTLYHNFANKERNLAQAQDALLSDWQCAIQIKQIKFIPEAKVYFKDYAFLEYPDKEKAKNYIQENYGHKNKKTRAIEYWWGGEQYPDFNTLFKALAEQKRFMELIIEVEE